MTEIIPINIEEIIKAFRELGGEATSREIQDQVIMNRGSDLPENFQSGGWDSYRKTILQKVHHHCPGYQKYKGPQYFEKTGNAKYALIESKKLGSPTEVAMLPVQSSEYQDTESHSSPLVKEYQRLDVLSSDINFNLPEEVQDSLYEGAKKQIVINSYERNPIARMKCINFYGAYCSVCNFSFENTYGSVGENYIHVHHIIPLSEINEEYEIDPLKHLRPVCPNCHAMIHRRKPAYTIEEMREVLLKKCK